MPGTLGAGMRLALVVWLALGCTDDEGGETNEDGAAVSLDSSLPEPIDRDASRDADSALDSAVATDAESLDAEVISCVALPIELTSSGGLVSFRNRALLQPCNTLRMERARPDGTLLESCSGAVDLNADPMTSINDLLMEDAVQDAMRDAPVTFGADMRFIDVPMTKLVIDGKVIMVGAQCADAGDGCPPIPEAIDQLLSQLRALIEEQIAATPSCSAFER
jgi:hypothetical protein